jgi:hypothetical protein
MAFSRAHKSQLDFHLGHENKGNACLKSSLPEYHVSEDRSPAQGDVKAIKRQCDNQQNSGQTDTFLRGLPHAYRNILIQHYLSRFRVIAVANGAFSGRPIAGATLASFHPPSLLTSSSRNP